MNIHIADDHSLVLEGFKNFLGTNGINVVGTSLNGDELINWLEHNKADVIVMDLSMPGKNGIEVLKYFKENNIEQNVIVVSAYLRMDFLMETIEYGGKGYILKEEAIECIIPAIYKVYEGETFYSEKVKEMLIEEHLLPNSKACIPARTLLTQTLSHQELKVLEMYVNNYSSDEIEEELQISKSTIRTYTSRMREKFNIKTTIGLAMRFAFLKNN